MEHGQRLLLSYILAAQVYFLAQLYSFMHSFYLNLVRGIEVVKFLHYDVGMSLNTRLCGDVRVLGVGIGRF